MCGIIVGVIISLIAEFISIVAIGAGAINFFSWFFAIGAEVVLIILLSFFEGSASTGLAKVLGIIGTLCCVFIFNIILFPQKFEGYDIGIKELVFGLLVFIIGPHLIFMSLINLFESRPITVVTGIAKLASTILLVKGIPAFISDEAKTPIGFAAIMAFLIFVVWTKIIIDIIKMIIGVIDDILLNISIKRTKQLFTLISENNKSAVLNLLSKGVNVNYEDSNDETPLYYAVKNNRKEIASILIENGADVNYVDSKGNTLLIIAIENNAKELVPFLVEKGVDVYKENSDMLNALAVAIKNRDKECASILIESGFDVNHEDTEKYSPLILVIINAVDDFIPFLIEKGADVNYEVSNGFTPLVAAICLKKIDVISLLIDKGADVNLMHTNGKLKVPIIFDTIDSENKEIISLLIDKGADINILAKNIIDDKVICATPLMYAVTNDKLDAVSILLEKGANPNVDSNDGWTPLQQAIWSKTITAHRKEIISRLVKYGADVNYTHKAGTPLALAISCDDEEIVSILLENGANPNYEDEKGTTPLNSAMLFSKVDIVKALIDHGADVNYIDENGNTPLISALTSFSVNRDIVLYLIANGADVNYETEYGFTPLFAAMGVAPALVSILISYGADVNYVNKDGETPLIHAAKLGNEEIMQILKDAGAVAKSRSQPSSSAHSSPSITATSPLSESSPAFTSALVSFSKIIARNSTEIFAPENKQKLTGLVSDFLSQNNEMYPILKQALQCDFTQMLLDANEKDDDKKSDAILKAVDKIVSEIKLPKDDAALVVRLVTLSLGWE